MLPVRDAHGELAGFIGRVHPARRPRRAEIPQQPRDRRLQEGQPAVRPAPGPPGPRPGRHARHRGRPVRRHRGHPRRPRPARRARPLRHRPDQPAGRTAQPGRRPGPHRHPRRLRRRHRRAQGRRPRPRHPPPAHRETASGPARRQGPRRDLAQDGPAALRAVLREHRQPLSALLIDASIESWERQLDDPDGRYLAMLNAAVLIADLLPAETAQQIRRITAGRELRTFDDLLNPVDNPELPRSPASCPPTPPTRWCGPPPGSASTSPTSWPKSPTLSPSTPAPQKAGARPARQP